jgi:hypothetical protein
MGVPLGDGGEKKFNWASELSTLFLNKSPSLAMAVGFSRVVPMRCGRFVFTLDLSKNPIEIGGAVRCTIATS